MCLAAGVVDGKHLFVVEVHRGRDVVDDRTERLPRRAVVGRTGDDDRRTRCSCGRLRDEHVTGVRAAKVVPGQGGVAAEPERGAGNAARDRRRPRCAVVRPCGSAVRRAEQRHRAERVGASARRRLAVRIRVPEERVRVSDDVQRVVGIDRDGILALISLNAAGRIDVRSDRCAQAGPAEHRVDGVAAERKKFRPRRNCRGISEARTMLQGPEQLARAFQRSGHGDHVWMLPAISLERRRGILGRTIDDVENDLRQDSPALRDIRDVCQRHRPRKGPRCRGRLSETRSDSCTDDDRKRNHPEDGLHWPGLRSSRGELPNRNGPSGNAQIRAVIHINGLRYSKLFGLRSR
jgi:hypothetical protein